MKTLANPKPVMISFVRPVAELRALGMVAWGGLCLDLAGLGARDMALRLGAPRLWLETVFETVARAGAKSLVLVDPDFNVFMGDPRENQRRLDEWAARQGVAVMRLSARGAARRAA